MYGQTVIARLLPFPSGLYALTPEWPDTVPLTERLAQVEAALAGGAVLVQYRNKHAPAASRATQARALVELCQGWGVPLIVNDDAHLARQTGAAGVHLGRTDGDVAVARGLLGETAIIGVSCYDDLARAEAAVAMGADYVAFGRVYPSTTKPDATPVTLSCLQDACRRLPCPVAAIGGITPDNAPPLVAMGVSLVAVVQGVFGQPDVRRAACAFATIFSECSSKNLARKGKQRADWP